MVYDFETVGGVNPHTNFPIQIAAKCLNPRTLEVLSNGTFKSFIQPDTKTVDEESLSFHAKARNITQEQVIELWKDAPNESQVWKDFAEFIKKFHTGGKSKSAYTGVIRAGANIVGFDNIIFDRLCVKHGFADKNGKQNLAFPRDNIDIQGMIFYWLENYADSPDSLSMDNLRSYFGINASTAHDAESDVDDTISILVPFMKLFRRTASSLNFRGALTKKVI